MSMPSAHHEFAQTRYLVLHKRTEAFCAAFLDLPNNSPHKILTDHFTPSNPRITEHGPSWATTRLPFLGKTFSGKAGCLEYFRLLSETLEFHPDKDTFPPKEGFVVDDKAMTGPGHLGQDRGWDGRGVVSVVGKGRFKAVKTGKSWEEQFIYRLSDFDEEGRIGHWEIWADPLSAWTAVS